MCCNFHLACVKLWEITRRREFWLDRAGSSRIWVIWSEIKQILFHTQYPKNQQLLIYVIVWISVFDCWKMHSTASYSFALLPMKCRVNDHSQPTINKNLLNHFAIHKSCYARHRLLKFHSIKCSLHILWYLCSRVQGVVNKYCLFMLHVK